MAISLYRVRDLYLAVQWTGSNEAEIEEFLARLGVSGTVTSSSGDLTVSWSAGSSYSSGSASALPTGYWLIEAFSSMPFGWTDNATFVANHRQVYP